MKKTLFVKLTVLILPLILFAILNATEVRKTPSHPEIPLTGDEPLPAWSGNGTLKKIHSPPRLMQVGTVVDSTTMDHQCNDSIHRRIATVGDSILHATAMVSYDLTNDYPTRGMKYFYYFNGNFINFGFVEGTGSGSGDDRGGYGSVVSYYTPERMIGNIAVMTSHYNQDGRAYGSHWYSLTDAFQGVGAFAPIEGPPGDGTSACDRLLWPSLYITNDMTGNMAMAAFTFNAACAGGFDDIKVTHKTFDDVAWGDTLLLDTLDDPSAWWNGPDIPDLDGADNGYMAVVTTDWQTNVYLWDSTDGGVNWSTRQDVSSLPTGPHYVPPDSSSTEYRPLQNSAIGISPDGTPHVVWTAWQARGTGPDTTWAPGDGLWSYRSKLQHWDSTNGINTIYRFPDNVANEAEGTAFAYNVGHASIGFGETSDIIYVVYEGFVDDDYDSTTQLWFGDIYVSVSTDGGATWQDRVNITNSIGSDDLYPAIARINPQGVVQEMPGFSVGNADGVNDFVMIYQNDDVAGTFMRGDETTANFDKLLVAPVDFETISVTGIGDEETTDGITIPKAFALNQNYPNPFNPSTVISYQLAERAQVSIKIHNVRGQVVRELVNGVKAAGTYSVQWNGRDEFGQKVSSGIYLYVLETDKGFRSTRKMVVLK